eukprot:g11676.t1
MKGSWLARGSRFSSSGLLRVGELQEKMDALLDEYASKEQAVDQKEKIATAIERAAETIEVQELNLKMMS